MNGEYWRHVDARVSSSNCFSSMWLVTQYNVSKFEECVVSIKERLDVQYVDYSVKHGWFGNDWNVRSHVVGFIQFKLFIKSSKVIELIGGDGGDAQAYYPPEGWCMNNVRLIIPPSLIGKWLIGDSSNSSSCSSDDYSTFVNALDKWLMDVI